MPRKERETTSQMIRREMVEKLRKIKTSPEKIAKLKSKVAASKRKPLEHIKKKKESSFAKFKREVKALLKADTVRTKDTQFQLKEAGVKFKTDREKAEEKRRKK